jgi:hypothetical protein
LLISHIERHLTEQELEDADPEGLCEQRAKAEFKVKCEDPLRNIGPSLKFAITSGLLTVFYAFSPRFDVQTCRISWRYGESTGPGESHQHHSRSLDK